MNGVRNTVFDRLQLKNSTYDAWFCNIILSPVGLRARGLRAWGLRVWGLRASGLRAWGVEHTTHYFSFLILVSRSRFFGLEGFWGQRQGTNFPSPQATMLALRLDCSTAALTTPQKALSIWRLIELKMLDFSDRSRNGISIFTSTTDRAVGYASNLESY